MIKKPTIYLIAIALITSLLCGSASATNTPSSKPSTLKPPCRVDMQLAHESTKLRMVHNVISVKSNVTVICDRPLQNIVVNIDLYKQAIPFPILLEPFTSPVIPYLAANTKLKVSGKPFICRNWKKSTFFSEVSSTAIMDGKKVTAPPRKSFRNIVECGS